MRSALRITLVSGLPLCIAWGLIEGAQLWLSGAVPFGGARTLTAAAIVYALLGIAIGTCTIALSWIRSRSSRADHREDTAPRALALYLALGVVGYAAFRINTEYLPNVWSAPSLLANAAFLLIAVPLVARALRALLTRVGPVGLVRLGVGAWIAVLVASAVPLLVSPAAIGAPPPRSRAPRSAPNVLFLLVDTLRADHLGCYGYARATSPHIDALAGTGVLFESCIAQAPHTKPSTASILTSLQPPTHAVERIASSLAPEATTMHEAFYQAGYRTALFSANSFVSPIFGFGEGVERYRGTLVSPVSALVGYQILHRLRDTWVEGLGWAERPWRFLANLANAPFDLRSDRRDLSAGEIADEFSGWLDEIEGDRWLAYLHFMEVHAPYTPTPEHRLFGDPGRTDPPSEYPRGAREMFLPFHTGEPLPEGERAALVASYDDCIHEVDAALGSLFARLEQRGLLENTLVVLTADHGEEFYEHHGWGHGHSLFRELLHVPLVMSFKGHLPAGVRVGAQTQSVDILPTILELAQLPPLPAASGESRVAWMRSPPTTHLLRQAAYSEVYWGGHWARAVRDAQATVIHAHEGREDDVLVFDPLADPREEHDLCVEGDPCAQAERERLELLRQQFRPGALAGRESYLDAATRARLRALGYVSDG